MKTKWDNVSDPPLQSRNPSSWIEEGSCPCYWCCDLLSSVGILSDLGVPVLLIKSQRGIWHMLPD